MRTDSPLRPTAWCLALAFGASLAAAPARAQPRISWSLDLPCGEKQIWSMRPDGSDKVNHFPAGLAPPAPFTEMDTIAGPSRGAYPIDPGVPGSPAVRWWLVVLRRYDPSEMALFAFAPDGRGGAVWRRITNFPREPEPGVRVGIRLLPPALPTGPGDGFASFGLSVGVHDGTAWQTTAYVARFADPFTRPAGSVGLGDLEWLAGAPANDSSNAGHTWSPDGRFLAYGGRTLAPDGRSLSAIRVLDTATGNDIALVASGAITSGGAFSSVPQYPSWSPDGSEIAFDTVGAAVGATTGTYAVNVSSGAIRAVTTTGTPAKISHGMPVWSPDGRSLAAVHYDHSGRTSIWDRRAIARLPASGVTKKDGAVVLTPVYERRNPTPLSWR